VLDGTCAHYGFQSVLVQIKSFVSESSSYSQSLPCIGLEHDLCQVMKFVCMKTSCCVAVLNKGLKLELHLLKQVVFILLKNYLYVLNVGSKHLSLQEKKFV